MWLRLSSMTESRSCAMSRLVPLGSHRRSSALVCSLVGRCHGERGSQKNTSMPSAASTSAQRAISRPWSQVRLRTSRAGWRPSAAATAAATWGAVAVGQRRGDRVAAGALGERDRSGEVRFADDEVAVPVAGLRAVRDVVGPVGYRPVFP